MGLRDELARFGLTALGAAGETLVDLASSTLSKAADETKDKPESDVKGSASVPKIPEADQDPKSLFFDPYAIIEQLGYKDRPSMITYGTLRTIMYRMPIISAIVQTRVNQMASFCQPQHDRYQLGFRIKLRDSEKEPTKGELKYIRDMEDMFMRTGVTENHRGRDDMETFIRRIVWDSLVYDQCTFEVVPNRKGQPAEWYAVDAATIRIADSKSAFADPDNEKAIRTVQVYDGMIIAEYTQSELCFGIRNPRSDIYLHGYGVSELEMLIQTITSLLYASEYNQKVFSQGSTQKGLLNFKGAIPEKQMASFRRQWYAQISGIQNSWRTPITNAEDIQWINMQSSARDMEYNAYFDFLIKTACAAYSMDPVEVNFKYGNTGQKGGLTEDNNRDKITESKERGLRPLMRFVARCFNRYIMWPINEDFEFEFVGLDASTRDGWADLNKKRVTSIMTVDEIRAEEDKPPLPDGLGEVILDPTWLQFAQAKEAGEEDEGGDEYGDFGGGAPGGGFEDQLAAFESPGPEEAEPAKPDQGPEPETEAEKSLARTWSIDL